MKNFTAFLLGGLFIMIANLIFAQCKDRKPFYELETECAKKHSDPSYLLDGQQYRAVIKGKENAEFYLTFYGGNLYRVAACSDVGGSVVYTVKDDPQGNVLYTNSSQQYAPFWDLEFSSTVNCKIEASFAPDVFKASADSTSVEGCTVLIIGYKQK
ncbi:MAG: hypothetical protein HYY40_02815 [Bacteroidetes bacterium]|nr:hypothetical protein [Bacteroidota bacterium]